MPKFKSHAEAARGNAEGMTVAQLVREIQGVSAFPEQPPIRVEYLRIMREVLAKKRTANSQLRPDS